MIAAFLTSRLTPYIAGAAILGLTVWFIWDRGGDARDAKRAEQERDRTEQTEDRINEVDTDLSPDAARSRLRERGR